jgi:hypothetical protein
LGRVRTRKPRADRRSAAPRFCEGRRLDDPEAREFLRGRFRASTDLRDRLRRIFRTPEKKSVDLRRGNEGWWKVPDQGRTGACVGVALANSVLQWHYGTAEPGYREPRNLLSARYLWMAAKEMDDIPMPTSFIDQAATKPEAALYVASRWGVPFEGTVPWRGGLFRGPEQDLRREAAIHTADPVTLGAREFALRRQFPRWLSNGGGPILIAIEMDRNFKALRRRRGEGRKPAELHAFRNPSFGQFLDGHAAALVGYEGNPRMFILRNSFGPTWGDGGYAMVSIEYLRGALRQAFGVLPRALPSDWESRRVRPRKS